MIRNTYIRMQPCPRCGSQMLWTEGAWRVRPLTAVVNGSRSKVDAAYAEAYACDNVACGTVLDPKLHPRPVATSH